MQLLAWAPFLVTLVIAFVAGLVFAKISDGTQLSWRYGSHAWQQRDALHGGVHRGHTTHALVTIAAAMLALMMLAVSLVAMAYLFHVFR